MTVLQTLGSATPVQQRSPCLATSYRPAPRTCEPLHVPHWSSTHAGCSKRQTRLSTTLAAQLLQSHDAAVTQLQQPPMPLAAARDDGSEQSWQLKYLYDGSCEMCRTLVRSLQSHERGRRIVRYVDISSPQYDAAAHDGIEADEAMETIHVRRRDGEWLYGSEALVALYDAVGIGWIARLAHTPLVGGVVDALYGVLSHHRMRLGAAVGYIVAAKRILEADKGVDTCSEDAQCLSDWTQDNVSQH